MSAAALKVLVEAGATPASAEQAVTILERGGNISEAREVIEVAPPATSQEALGG